MSAGFGVAQFGASSFGVGSTAAAVTHHDLTPIQRLLPRGPFWSLPEGPLRELFQVVADGAGDVREFIAATTLDLFASATTRLDLHEHELGLHPAPSLTDTERQARIVARAGDHGTLCFADIEETLHGMGFPLHLHAWFDPVTGAARDLSAKRFIRDRTRVGSRTLWRATGGVTGGSRRGGQYAGTILMEEVVKAIDLKVGDAWPYTITVGGEAFGATVEIPAARRDELEFYLLGRVSHEQTLAMDVEYV